MPPRYPGYKETGVPDFSNYDPAFVQADKFKVNFNGCASDFDRYNTDRIDSEGTYFTYSWSFPGSEGTPTVEGKDCTVSRTYKQGSYEVTLTIKDPDTNEVLGTFKNTITVKDKLIVAIGDSYGAGEGSPDVPQQFYLGIRTQEAKWADKRCHRSGTAGVAQAAKDLEYSDPHSSVTFVFLDCSGASIERKGDRGVGILGDYWGIDPDGTINPPQLDEVQRLVGDRRIDKLVISAGGNDSGFGTMVDLCASPLHFTEWNCSDQGDILQRRLDTMDQVYKDLNQRIKDLKLNIDNVYLTEYPDPTLNTNGTYCGGPMWDPLLSLISSKESEYISSQMARPLNKKMSDFVTDTNKDGQNPWLWHYVDGIDEEYAKPLQEGHGYCANDHWINTMLESNDKQGPHDNLLVPPRPEPIPLPGGGAIPSEWEATTGTLHPNAMGQDVYKRHIWEAIHDTQSLGATFSASEPEHASDRVTVRVTATAPSGITDNSVSVDGTGACNVQGITCTTDRPDGQTLQWTLVLTEDGIHHFEFTAKDGDEQASSFIQDVKADFTPPGAPVIKDPADNSEDTDGSFTVSGTAEVGSTVELFDGQDSKGTVQADGSGNWSKDLTGVSAGSHSYTATATDEAGNTSSASDPVTVIVVDKTRPTLDSVQPNDRATNVALNTNVTATFSEEIDESTLNASTIKLKVGKKTVPIGISCDAPCRKVTLDPYPKEYSRLLAANKTYKVIITNGVKDKLGNRLAKTYSWTFTTANSLSPPLPTE